MEAEAGRVAAEVDAVAVLVWLLSDLVNKERSWNKTKDTVTIMDIYHSVLYTESQAT